jgi:DNA-directed RNA polymerase subunit RPC12/RpoP
MSGADYWYRCGACGGLSPANRWIGEADSIICPVCNFTHADGDGDPGIEDGTFEELQAATSSEDAE